MKDKFKETRGQLLNTDLDTIELERKDDFYKEGYVVLALIPKRHEYVTWYMSMGGVTVQGHYTTNLQDALDDFNKRH